MLPFNEPREANVKKNKQLALAIAAATTLATLAGTSAFAENRPSNETRARASRRAEGRIERDRSGDTARRSDETQNRQRAEVRDEQRNQRDEQRGDTRSSESRGTWRNNDSRNSDSRNSDSRGDSRNRSTYDNRGNDSRNRSTYDNRDNRDNRSRDNRGYDNRGYDNRNRSSDNRQPYYANGRVSRVDRYGSGYRVWVGGARFPFFVPLAYYRGDRFRIGVSIQLGGYYNPLGYYDYYDPGYYDSRGYSGADLRGTVESVDYRRDTFVVRNDATGSFVTVASSDRRTDRLRAGDYVELSGDWSRSGLFQAYQVDVLDSDNYRR
jgi:hypothetical protein